MTVRNRDPVGDSAPTCENEGPADNTDSFRRARGADAEITTEGDDVCSGIALHAHMKIAAINIANTRFGGHARDRPAHRHSTHNGGSSARVPWSEDKGRAARSPAPQ